MKANFDAIIGTETPVVVDFFAEWCGPCKSQAPILRDFAETMGEKVRVIKVDVDKNNELAQRFSIQSVPTIMVFQNGKSHFRQSGVVSKNQLMSIVEKL